VRRTAAAGAIAIIGFCACGGNSPAKGVIAGQMYAVGGPMPGTFPLSGSVEIERPDRVSVARTQVSKSGAFSVEVPAGTYIVVGVAPGNRLGPMTVAVRSGRTAHIDLVLDRK
jgi:hypothetical protein